MDKHVTLQQNEVYDCQYALHIGNEFDGYAGDVDILFSSVGNNYHDNVDGGLVLRTRIVCRIIGPCRLSERSLHG